MQILIVSAVKMCKQCLQTASLSGPPTGASFLDTTEGLPSPDPQIKTFGAGNGFVKIFNNLMAVA